MFCARCGKQNSSELSFCRQCGSELETGLLPNQKGPGPDVMRVRSKDPEELTGNGIGSVIVGDGFFMVAVILSATHSPVSSLLWLSLLIPAFFFFGKGFSDVLLAREIRRRRKQEEFERTPQLGEIPPPRASVVEVLKRISGDLAAVPSVTERTTRDLN